MKKNILKKIISASLIFFIIFSTFFSIYPPKAKAILGVGDISFDPAALTQSILNGVAQFGTQALAYSDNYKEYVLDPIVSVLAKQMIQSITNSIVDWINNGFQGSPSFVQNPGAFFLDLADQATGNFIQGDLATLCSPFSIDVRIALSFKYHPRARQRFTCTLGTIIQNTTNAVKGASINGFTAGDFKQGGWPAFVSLTTEPQNNIYGSYLQADSDLSVKVAGIQAQRKDELSQGKGFLSFRDPACVKRARAASSGKTATTHDDFVGVDVTTQGGVDTVVTPEQDCPVQTPGSVISGALDTQLGSPARQLELADEIGEIMNALVAQLTSQILRRGLSTVSEKGSDGKSYLDTVSSAAQADQAQTAGIRFEILKNIDQEIATTDKYRKNVEVSYKIVADIKNDYDSAKVCYLSKISGQPPLTSEQAAIAQSRIGGIDSALASSTFSQTYNLVSLRYEDANTKYNTLVRLKTTASTATSTEAINSVTTEFGNILRNLVTALDIQDALDQIRDVTNTTKVAARDAADQARICQGFPANLTK